MTNKQIWEDIKSDRVKKVILDCDFAAEVDDQYTFMYALGSEKIDLLSAGVAAVYEWPDRVDTEKAMLEGYDEIMRVCRICGVDTEKTPIYKGATRRITADPNHGPSDSPAARNIIETVKNSDEIVYVCVTGPCTNVVSACMMEPSICEKLCVIWLGGHCVEENISHFHEWNLYSDYAAGQKLMDLDIPLIMIPCDPVGSVMIKGGKNDFGRIIGDDEAGEFLRRGLMLRCYSPEKYDREGFMKVMCDYASIALLTMPDCMKIEEISAPIIADDERYILDDSRRKILYGTYPDSQRIVDDAIDSINNYMRNR